MRKLLVSKILPALRVFAYNHGMRPKYGSPLFSPSLNVIFFYKDHVKKMRHLRK